LYWLQKCKEVLVKGEGEDQKLLVRDFGAGNIVVLIKFNLLQTPKMPTRDQTGPVQV
jgi:hypothetical protein